MSDAREAALRELICDIGRRMWVKDMVASNDGNISVRLDDQRVLCSPTATSKGQLHPELLPVVDLQGRQLPDDPCPVRPSSEIKMHVRIYQRDETVNAVVHAHPMYATAWAVRGEGLQGSLMPEAVLTMPDVPLAPYATPSTEAVPDSIEPFIGTRRACLLEHHGALAWGADLEVAYGMMERLEYLARMTWILRQAGAERHLPAEEIAHLHELLGSGY